MKATVLLQKHTFHLFHAARWLATLLAVSVIACGERPDPPAGNPEGERTLIDLPPARRSGDISVETAIRNRRSIRAFADQPLSREILSQLLWAAQGVTEPRRQLRAAPSAGATYPLEIYAVTADGVYRYHPAGHQLEAVLETDQRAALANAALRQDFIATAPVTLVFCAVEERTTRRYGDRGRLYVHIEIGHAAQNVLLQAVALGWGSVPVGAFDTARTAALLDLRQDEQPLYLLPVGQPSIDLDD